MTRQQQAWLFIALYLAATGWVVYTLTVDPDPVQRRLARLDVRYRALQHIAETIGDMGLRAEREYHRVAEQNRTI
jgi:hypothetical protein